MINTHSIFTFGLSRERAILVSKHPPPGTTRGTVYNFFNFNLFNIVNFNNVLLLPSVKLGTVFLLSV